MSSETVTITKRIILGLVAWFVLLALFPLSFWWMKTLEKWLVTP